jgi:hypothetical protein
MAYTKDIALSDKITIDGTDASNAFRTFGLDSTDDQVDASGFSETGNDELLQGKRAQSFSGECFYTPESYALLYPLYRDRTTFELEWQPDGLADDTREVWYGNVKLLSFNPTATRGDVRVMTCTFTAADADGIVAGAAT